MGPRAFNRVCASIRINRDYDVVSVRINAHGVTKRAWAFNCETTVHAMVYIYIYSCCGIYIYIHAQVQSMDDNCGEWVECMGVASGCGEQEVGVTSGSGWNLWVWLLGVVVRRYIDLLLLQ